MNLWRHRDPIVPRQRGFSMVEMLLAAFIMAIGLLGLTVLQTMSVKVTTSGRTLSTAVLVAEGVLNEIETNARNSLLYRRSSPPTTLPTNLVSFHKPPKTTYNFAGRPSVGDPVDSNPFFTVTVQSNPAIAPDAGVANPVPGLGGLAYEVVDVEWTETPGAPARHVVLSRRVAYATNS